MKYTGQYGSLLLIIECATFDQVAAQNCFWHLHLHCLSANQHAIISVHVCVTERVCVHSCDVKTQGLDWLILPRAAHLQFSEHHTERARLPILSLWLFCIKWRKERDFCHFWGVHRKDRKAVFWDKIIIIFPANETWDLYKLGRSKNTPVHRLEGSEGRKRSSAQTGESTGKRPNYHPAATADTSHTKPVEQTTCTYTQRTDY